ncbi:MAG: hypothetical protein M3273_01580 [Actinomycetota bacterium]|nr:hypothetical protein [Actinomycetota bacterium]
MTPGDTALVVAQLVAFVLVGWAMGAVLLRWARFEDAGLPERTLAAVVGFVCFSVLLMVGNIVTGGAVFGLPGVAPVLAIAPVYVWIRSGRAAADVAAFRIARSWIVPAALGAVLFFLYVLPVLVEGSGVRTGDPPWHLGWTEQLLGGEPLPAGPAPELARNAYPWGYHAVLATMVRLVPSSTPLLAHEAVHVVLVVSIPLAAACLARRVRPSAGAAAAACTSLVGGFGWILAREPAFVPSPRAGRFGADLVVASPNSVYELLPPAFPRELGLVLAGCAALLLVHSLETRRARDRIAAGVVVGLVGVVSVPMLFTAAAWGLVAVLFARDVPRLRAVAQIWGPALLVFALWAAPVASGYIRYGGFVDITPRLGMEWPLPTALGSWGLLLPLAVGGTAVAMRSPLGRLVAGFAGASAALLALAVARDVFDWSVWNNATLLHQGRMWPPAHLLAGVLGGLALAWAYAWVRARSRLLAAAAAAGLLVVGAASPALASMQMREILREHRDGFVYGREDFAAGSFAREAAELLGPDDVVFVSGSDRLAWTLFQLSGARLAAYDDPRLDGNELRIRYADLARAWDRRAAAADFAPTHVVALSTLRGAAGEELVTGTFEGETWTLRRLD